MGDEIVPLPPRGWYPDPAGGAAWRWWDGGRWTDDLHAYQTSSAVPAGELATEEQLASRFVRIGIPIYVVLAVASVATRVIDAGYTHDLVTWFRSNLAHLSTPGFVASTPPQQPLASSFLVLPELVATVVMLVLLLTAQHKMATIARSLGIRSRFTPTWGVLLWFIPVVDLVLPAFVWRDLLPDGHPLRHQITLAWLAYVGSGILGVGALLASLASTVLVAVIAIMALGLQLVVARMLPGILTGVVAHHSATGTTGQTTTSAL